MVRAPARLLVLTAALLAAGWGLVASGRGPLRDFQVNRQAGDRLLHGETLYRVSDEHYQFKYAPFSAMIYVPLALLPLPAAKAAWLALVLAAILAAAAWSARLSGLDRRTGPWRAALPALILAKYFLRELELGQINAVITALFLGLAWLLSAPRGSASRRPAGQAAAGLLAGLGAALKPYGLIMLPYLLLRRRWTAFMTATGFVAASLLLPSVFYGWEGNGRVHAEWARTLSQSTPPLLVSRDNVSLLAFFAKWIGPGPTATLLYAAGLAVLAAATVFVLRKGRGLDRPEPLEIGLLLLFIPLISPLGWEYTYLSAILAVSLLLAAWARLPRGLRILLAADLAVIALSIYDLMRPALFRVYLDRSIPTIAFLILAAALVEMRRRKLA